MVYNNKHSNKRLGLISLAALALGACAVQPQPVQHTRPDTVEDHSYMTQGSPAPEISNDVVSLLSAWEEDHATSAVLDPEFKTLSADEAINDEDQTATPVNDGRIPRKYAGKHRNPDLWQRIRQGFALPDRDHPRTLGEQQWFAQHQEYLDRTVTRARPYLHYITEEVEKRGIPTEIALLPIIESAFQPFAYSHGRAAGIWQFIPATGRLYGLKQNWWYDGRRDIMASTGAALNYLETLHKKFDGDWLLALAAYNSGEGTVASAIRINKSRGKPVDFWSLNLPRETRAYVPKLLAISSIIARPETYNIVLESIPDEPNLVKIDIDSQIDLALAAELAGMTLEELYHLNPGFNRWATDPDGPHHLLLSIDKAEHFQERLAELPVSNRVKWKRHEIREGETLSHIASKYKTTVSVLRDVNKLRGNFIKTGQNLIIPVATKHEDDYALSADRRTQTIQNSVKEGLKVIYIVNEGDSLWDIAQKYDVTVREIAAWNGMATLDRIKPGQTLVIWWKDKRITTSDISMSLDTGLSQDAITQRINYIVRKGDSLERISERFRISVSKLLQWNPLSRGKTLHPGQKLTLFVDVTNQTENI